jgi:signal peptidase II
MRSSDSGAADEQGAPSLVLVSGMVALAILVIDQSTKLMVRSVIPPCGPSGCLGFRAGPLAIINLTNRQAPFSPAPGTFLWILMTIASLVLILRLAPRLRTTGRSWTLPLALGLLAGGALGNLTDRVLHGGVTDFLVPGAYVSFNLADVAALIGTVMTIVIVIRNRAKLSPRRPLHAA